jgi:WXG100 family type VII secretion target
MSSFSTTTDEMEQASRHVRTVNETVQGDLARLRSQLAPLEGAWQGAAAAQFSTLMARWDASAARLNSALRDIGESIHSSAVDYQHQEDAQAASMSSITGALG